MINSKFWPHNFVKLINRETINKTRFSTFQNTTFIVNLMKEMLRDLSRKTYWEHCLELSFTVDQEWKNIKDGVHWQMVFGLSKINQIFWNTGCPKKNVLLAHLWVSDLGRGVLRGKKLILRTLRTKKNWFV